MSPDNFWYRSPNTKFNENPFRSFGDDKGDRYIERQPSPIRVQFVQFMLSTHNIACNDSDISYSWNIDLGSLLYKYDYVGHCALSLAYLIHTVCRSLIYLFCTCTVFIVFCFIHFLPVV